MSKEHKFERFEPKAYVEHLFPTVNVTQSGIIISRGAVEAFGLEPGIIIDVYFDRTDKIILLKKVEVAKKASFTLKRSTGSKGLYFASTALVRELNIRHRRYPLNKHEDGITFCYLEKKPGILE